MQYARIKDGKVIEISPPLPDGTEPSDWYPAGWHWEPMADGVTTEWTWNGSTFVAPPLPPTPDLGEVKVALKAAIDAAAETERARYITPGAGQAMTYQQKAAEARAFTDAENPVGADYPMLSAEVGITAADVGGVAASVLTAEAAWRHVGAAIEGIRLGAKKAIDEAADAEAAEEAANVTWLV